MAQAKYTNFRPRLRSRHPSHSILRPRRKILPLLPFRSVIRLGSTTEIKDDISHGGARVEVNTVNSIENSSNKLKMKTCFSNADVMTANWWQINNDEEGNFNLLNPVTNETVEYGDIEFPLVIKKFYGSRNNGNTKVDDLDQLETFISDNNMKNCLIEKFHNYSREYRVHVTEEGCFYTCRKMLKSDTPEEAKWYRNDKHCVWVMESNELFDRPSNWGTVVEECVKALKAVGLDIGAVDLKIQSATNKEGEVRENPNFIVIEINSAPSFGKVTEQKYLEVLPTILKKKFSKL